MATFLKRGNFNGSNGSHFFLDLYYDVLSSNSVRFYAYVGSIDGYSASGSSSSVTINGTSVGSITSIPARSNTLVGYLDVSGSGVISATASCSTTWNGVGSASASGTVSVGPYITSFSVSPRDETSVIYNWSVSSPADYGWFSLDGVNWYNLPTNNIIGNLTPGQSYNFYIKLKQASTQVEYTAGPYVQTTYNYPYIQSANDFTIGEVLTINIYNPLHRNCSVYVIGNGNSLDAIETTSNIIQGFNGSVFENYWYYTIPNQKQAQFDIRLVVNELGRDTRVYGGIYSIKYNEIPLVTTTATDTGKTLTGNESNITTTYLTGDNKKIIKYISDVEVSVSATGQYYATIPSLATQYWNSAAISGTNNPLIHTYNNVENITFTGHAIDSRGLRSGSQASGLTLIDYIKLTLNELELYRDEQTSSTLKCRGNGNYFSGNFGSQNNSLVFKLRYKEKNSSTWGSWSTKTMTIGTNTYSFDFTVGTNFDYTKTYDFQFEIADKCMKVTDSETAKPGIPIQGLFESFVENFGIKSFINDNGELVINGDIKVSGSNKYLKNL